jgi:hypothetical protein
MTGISGPGTSLGLSATAIAEVARQFKMHTQEIFLIIIIFKRKQKVTHVFCSRCP